MSPAASQHRLERPTSDSWRRASLPMVVVLPTPFTPTTSQTSTVIRGCRRSGADGTRRMSSSWPGSACTERGRAGRSPLAISLVRHLRARRLGPSSALVVCDPDVGPDERLFERVPGLGVDTCRLRRAADRSTEESPGHRAETAAVRGRSFRSLELRCRLGFDRNIGLRTRAASPRLGLGSASRSPWPAAWCGGRGRWRRFRRHPWRAGLNGRVFRSAPEGFRAWSRVAGPMLIRAGRSRLGLRGLAGSGLVSGLSGGQQRRRH